MQGVIPSRHPKYRTKLCRNFVSGDCPFGQKCSFLHPVPKTDSATLSLVQHLSRWNPLLLPQLLALSTQEASKTMPRRSPPRSQGPQVIDEDPSPTTSLLLSKSDCTSSEQVPQTKGSNRRKKYPCRHFIRTGGWCPAAGQCKFQHGVAALPSAGVRKPERALPFATDAYGEGPRTISGGVLMGIQSPSPPIVNQAHSVPTRYADAELIRSCSSPRYSYLNAGVFNPPLDQPMYWPNYTWQPYRPYYTAIHIPITAAPSSIAQHSVYPPPQPQAQTTPLSEVRTSLPSGSYEVNGTTYFPAPMLRASAQPPVPCSFPIYPLTYNPPMAPAYPYYAPPGLPAGYYDANQTRDVGPQTSTLFDPFASDRMVPSDLPVISRLEDYQMSPVQQDVLSLQLSSVLPSAVCGELGSMSSNTSGKPAPEYEFPYQPTKDQRVGHARRISVNIKKHGRVNSG